MNQLILDVEQKEMEDIKVGNSRRRAEKRRGYDFFYLKWMLLNQIDSDIRAADVAFENHINI